MSDSGRAQGKLISDRNGTLVDSLPGIEASLARAVAVTQPELRLSALRDYIGPRIATTITELRPQVIENEAAAVLASFRRHYDAEGW